ncbi:MAG: aminotransferase class III-fold pyridoxal phosphate-dependent enzyme [Candidatus Eremiobacteraeota bacterium]|nr:aminotransferase class III-fold pyridoxal phosphate-dependent enzyme [Candidatus Eremiobacteraeota bacterium]
MNAVNAPSAGAGALHARYVLTPWVAQSGRTPPVIVRGEGSYLYDEDDRRYLDFSAGLVAVNLGHAHSGVATAIAEQARRLAYVAPTFANDRRAELARAIVEIAPWSEGARVFFTTGGGEANEDAIKFARSLTGRHKICSAYRSFHGSAPGAGTLSGENRRWPNEPGIPGVVRFFAPFPYRSPFHARDLDEEADRAIEHLETIVAYEGAANIAALLIEPVVGTNGVVVYPQAYLPRVRELCDRHGILLIFDEVMTGFGRTGAPFAAQRFDVRPDIITFAKGVTSAYVPLGGVALREGLAQHFDRRPLPSGHTFSGHPLAMAAGVAALRAYREERLFERAREIEAWLRARFESLARRHPVVGEVRGVGAFFGIELVSDRQTRAPLVPWQGATTLHDFFNDLLANGLYVLGRYNVAIVAPPLTIEPEQLDEGFAILDNALERLESRA